MALINKTGITNGGTIQAEHITRAIDALSGGSTDSVSITGSLMGSASYAANAGYATSFPFTGSARMTGSLIVTGSVTISGSANAHFTASSRFIRLGAPLTSASFVGTSLNSTAEFIRLESNKLTIVTADSLSGSIVGDRNLTLDLNPIGFSGQGYFSLPIQAPASNYNSTGIFWCDPIAGKLYLYDSDANYTWSMSMS